MCINVSASIVIIPFILQRRRPAVRDSFCDNYDPFHGAMLQKEIHLSF